MVTPQLLHFVVRNITYTPTDTGYLITCYTNNFCHLYLRWTSIVPAKHIIPRLVRGGQVGTYIDQCFVSYKDLEQNEAGDTFTHTFTCEPWPRCETRWFYFWGTVASVLSPSASAIFYKHRPYQFKIYSDSGSGAVTCDGEVQKIDRYLTWSEVRNGPADLRNLSGVRYFTFLSSDTRSNTWRSITRNKSTFDLSPIPFDLKITAVSLHFHVDSRNASFITKPEFALVTAPAPPYNNIPLSDYNKFGTVPISNMLYWHQITSPAHHHLDVLPTFLSLFIPGQKVSISIREMKNDADNNPPPWQSAKSQWLQIASIEHDYPTWRPYLLVNATK